ncbi:CAP domain-containing protein [Duganella sp. FT134W]|uniref:CAP domain-containing protein n=1 Tax=Duganella margarita TaxID=2692170 RepID=A0A7X4KJV3_9BURK|nr:CAP domain-containing protein [Duganella margarita]MYM76074.1 CAP domain-containing protein [Duganella margarita]
MKNWRLRLAAWLVASLLAACGGGGGSDSTSVTGPATTAPPLTLEPGAPTMTGNTAIDGFNWINYRRAQLGLSVLTRNNQITAAAQGHSDYQRINNTITHEETSGLPGFTGVGLVNRLNAAGYTLTSSYAAGEVISATSDTSGFYQAEQLITAIYHRFVIFEPVFRELGTGAATASGGTTYFTADFAVRNSFSGLGAGRFVTYPRNQQTKVPVNFFSDTESPDPVPNQNEVGYPISLHADSYGSVPGTVVVQSFTVAPRGAAALSTRLLSYAAGTNGTTSTAAAIVPLAPLKSATTYDVNFTGTVGGVAVNTSWSFSTQ